MTAVGGVGVAVKPGWGVSLGTKAVAVGDGVKSAERRVAVKSGVT